MNRTLPLAAAVCASQLTPAFAATLNWNTNSSGDWHNPNNWSPANVPGAADVAVVARPSVRPVNTYSSASGERDVGGLRVNDEVRFTGGTLTLLSTRTDNRFDENSILRINGGVFSFKTSGTLDIDNDFILTGGRFRTENFSSTVPAGVVQIRGAFNQSGGAIRGDGEALIRFTGQFAAGREHSWSGGAWDGAGFTDVELVDDGVMNIGANDANLNTLDQFFSIGSGTLNRPGTVNIGGGLLRIDGRASGGFGGVGLLVGSFGSITNDGVMRILCDGSGVRAIEGTSGGFFSDVINRAQETNFASFENLTGGTAPLGANLRWENRGTVNITNAGGIDYQGEWNNISGYVTVGGGGVFRFSGGGTWEHTGYSGGSGMTLQANNTVRFAGLHTVAMKTGNLVFEPGSSMVVEGGTALDFSGASVLTPGHLIVEGGTLILGKDGGNAGNQFGASAARLTIHPGGVVNYARSHQVQDGTGVNIDGGTINLSGFVETYGALSLSGGARINGPGEVGLVVGSGGFIQVLDTSGPLISADLAVDGQLTIQVPAIGLLSATGAVRQGAGALDSGITKTGAGELQVGDLNIGSALLQGGEVALNGANFRLHNMRSLAITRDAANQPTARLDLSNDAVSVDYAGASPLAALQADILFARNGGLWNRNGITSDLLTPNDPDHAIGFAEASAVLGPAGGAFLGEMVDGSTVLVRYTLLGDADLSGVVNVDDFGRLAANFNQVATWSSGDFNYNGVANIDDFGLLASHFNQVLAAPAHGRGSAIPEPAGALLGLAILAICPSPRRRRGLR